MPWHFAEQLACMHWARPERTFCTRAHRVAASHCRRPALVLALPHSQPTRPDSSLAAELLLELHSATTASRHRRSDSLCHGRRRPSHSRTPACPLEQWGVRRNAPTSPNRLHVALLQQNGGLLAFLSTATGTNLSGLYIALPIMPKLVSILVRADRKSVV